jgi:hypothetical protein
VGYYAYARAPLIEHSLDFTHDYQLANGSFREACFRIGDCYFVDPYGPKLSTGPDGAPKIEASAPEVL